jgi:hypothetical protein
MMDHGYQWRDRNGGRHGVEFVGYDMTPSEADDRARAYGWPGHAGFWYSYLRQDVSKFLERLKNAVR